ncbi:MAG TPA: hypothetical protein VLV86_05375, partial [Vicinamibacterales bacterium]|nr:hypothetical protein [Vicinamibacterales bacterium]
MSSFINSTPAVVLAAAVALHATTAAAQNRPSRVPPPVRGDVSVGLNVGTQLTGDDLSENFSVTKNAEPAPITVAQPFSPGVLFDGGVLVRARRKLGIAVDLSVFTREHAATIDARIPHPVVFNQPRPISGATPLSEWQTAIHIDAAYLAQPRRRVSVAVLGGVSIFHLTRSLVTDLNVSDPYPFDTPTLASAVTTDASATVVGFNAGLDVTWRRWRRAGLGALVRYSRASATLSAG